MVQDARSNVGSGGRFERGVYEKARATQKDEMMSGLWLAVGR